MTGCARKRLPLRKAQCTYMRGCVQFAENLRENEEGELVDEEHDQDLDNDHTEPDAKRSRFDDDEDDFAR